MLVLLVIYYYYYFIFVKVMEVIFEATPSLLVTSYATIVAKFTDWDALKVTIFT